MLLFPSSCYIAASSNGNEFQIKKNTRPVEIIRRPLANNPSNISPSRFISYTFDNQVYDGYLKEMEPLKEEIRKHINACSRKRETAAEKLNLIDTVERLGLSYHFKEEIEKQLEQVFYEMGSSDYHSDDSDLTAVALRFRLCRQHGFNITSDIFNRFTENGKFKNSLKKDLNGLLNLYEAAHVRTRSDKILEEGLVFSKIHLSSRAKRSPYSYLEKQVEHALQQPLHRGIPILEAHHFTSIYEEEEDRLKNESLLRLAKLNHNSLQLLHREELSSLLRWWKDFESVSNLPQVRDRIIEYYFMGLSSCMEPQYATSRSFYAKYCAVGSLIDDLFDAYCTPDELKIFVRAIERWDLKEIDQLPGCMILCFRAFAKMIDELGNYALQHGKPFATFHIKESWKDFSKCSQIQGDWLARNELPPFADYIRNGAKTSGLKPTVFVMFLPMESATEAVFDWLSHDPPIALLVMKLVRLQNDVCSYQFEKDKGIATGIDCYMKNYNVSEETAKLKFWEMIEDAWKDINEEICTTMRTAPLSEDKYFRIVNQARIMSVVYREIDGFTFSQDVMEPLIDQVLFNAFSL